MDSNSLGVFIRYQEGIKVYIRCEVRLAMFVGVLG